MTSSHTTSIAQARPGEPVWNVMEYLPEQGSWTERKYLTVFTERGVEFNDGMLEVLPVATKNHQLVLGWFFTQLSRFIAGKGIVVFGGYKLRLQSETVKYREPDIIHLTPEQTARAREEFADTAEIVAEVVNPDDSSRDYAVKRGEYATVGIPEYWILDPAARHILVLGLEGSSYVERGKYGPGQRAMSGHLPDFGVEVDDMLAQVQTRSSK